MLMCQHGGWRNACLGSLRLSVFVFKKEWQEGQNLEVGRHSVEGSSEGLVWFHLGMAGM